MTAEIQPASNLSKHVLYCALCVGDSGGAILALLVCRDRKSIRIRYVIQLLVIEVLLAYFSCIRKRVWAS